MIYDFGFKCAEIFKFPVVSVFIAGEKVLIHSVYTLEYAQFHSMYSVHKRSANPFKGLLNRSYSAKDQFYIAYSANTHSFIPHIW
jgi:hypothetical protein